MNRRVKKITTILDKKKGEDIAVFDLGDSDYFVDFVVIATSMADKHGQALLNELKDELKPKGEQFLHVDDSEGWIVIDLGDILVHLMNSEQRARFRLEEFLDNIKTQRESAAKPAAKKKTTTKIVEGLKRGAKKAVAKSKKGAQE